MEMIEKSYGSWIRSKSQRRIHTKWLRAVPAAKTEVDGGNGSKDGYELGKTGITLEENMRNKLVNEGVNHGNKSSTDLAHQIQKSSYQENQFLEAGSRVGVETNVLLFIKDTKRR